MPELNLKLSVFRRVMALVKPYKMAFILCSILAIVLAPLAAATPYLINIMTDKYLIVGDMPGLLQMILIYFGVLFLTVILRYTFIYRTNLLGQNLIRDLRVKIYNHVSRLNLGFFDRTPVGQLTTRTINDTEVINAMFSQGFIPMIADFLAVFAVLGAMFITSIKLTLISLIMLPVLVISSYIFKEKVRVAYEKLRQQLSRMNTFLQERITGMRVIQIFNAEDQEMTKFKEINRAYTQENINNIFYYAVFLPVVEIISASALALMVWWGARDVLSSDITLGDLIAFPMFLSLLFRPIRMLADKFNSFQLGLVASERVFKVLDRSSEIPDTGTFEIDRLKGQIEFKSVQFSYIEGQPVLNGLSFKVMPGESLAIVGSTGSGKTTVISLLARLYDIQKGEILLDDVEIRDYTLDSLRDKMAVVLQDVFLFRNSIFENIRLMRRDISRDEVIAASKMIGAHDYINQLPGGYDYEIMERGANLSMGQRQLISFVRALVFNPDILILDEATSSIDKETEATIQSAIEKLITNRTSIIIAHRLSTIRHADHIMVLEHGRIVQWGNHDTLIKDESGVYYALNKMQVDTTVITEEV